MYRYMFVRINSVYRWNQLMDQFDEVQIIVDHELTSIDVLEATDMSKDEIR